MVHWDADGRKDLLVGRSDGKIELFLNVGTDASPIFDAGTLLEVGPTGSKVTLDVGGRATPKVVDWDDDGRKDLVVGGYDGRIRIFRNEGSDAAPDFVAETRAQDGGGDLLVPTARSSPAIVDVDYDGRKDLLSGNTGGQLLYYRNVGTDAAPTFSGYVQVASDGVPIQYPSWPRTRPSVCDWRGDGLRDVLIGIGDGRVHLLEGVLRIQPLCFGDGLLLPCPCGNDSAPGSGEGCENSTGVGAILSFTGTNLVAVDDLVLHVSQALPGKLAIFLQGETTRGVPFMEGILCLGNPLLRLEPILLDGSGNGSTSVSLVTAGGIHPGRTVSYQTWYRAANGPCSKASNVSAGLQVDWR